MRRLLWAWVVAGLSLSLVILLAGCWLDPCPTMPREEVIKAYKACQDAGMDTQILRYTTTRQIFDVLCLPSDPTASEPEGVTPRFRYKSGAVSRAGVVWPNTSKVNGEPVNTEASTAPGK